MPPPDEEARYEILKVHTRKMSIGDDVDLHQIAKDTDLFTGAELEGLCKEAGMLALREDMTAKAVLNRHFQRVKNSLRPSLTYADIHSYSSFSKNQSRKPSTNLEHLPFKAWQPDKKSLLTLAMPGCPLLPTN